jgi:hypothetical protein
MRSGDLTKLNQDELLPSTNLPCSKRLNIYIREKGKEEEREIRRRK